jgi:hypothetical protein
MATVTDCILIAAASLTDRNRSFSAEDLVVRAWEIFPDKFGLQGYSEKFPDSNRVLTKLMGASGRLRKDGLIERIGEKRYRLTPAGMHASAELTSRATGDGGDETRRLAQISREFLPILRRLITSPAFRKFRHREALSFSDVAALLNISARSTANQLNTRRNEADAAVTAARSVLGSGRGRMPGMGEDITSEQIETVANLLQQIDTQFKKEFDVIRARSHERYR